MVRNGASGYRAASSYMGFQADSVRAPQDDSRICDRKVRCAGSHQTPKDILRTV